MEQGDKDFKMAFSVMALLLLIALVVTLLACRLRAPRMHDIAEFLKAHELFRSLEPEELERLAERVEIEYFDAGDTIFRQGESPPDAMWVLRTGAVELRDDGRVLDLLGAGEPFGHPWMLSGLPAGWEARAREGSLCYRLAAEDVIPLLSDPAGLRSVARALMDRPRPGGEPTARTEDLDVGQEAVRVLVRKRPVSASPGCPCATPPRGWRSRGSARSSSTQGMAISGSSPTATSARGWWRPVSRWKRPWAR